ncbi:PQQ-dependent sugar dehydrogenase [Sediminibacillus massiliensis]|uniref:PQQ-dependent sugar dehydrogenase n=1 Tax=Sediminibacillus massiliensis TaxID=1926277 RepID=UPI0009886A6E|nr:PQQ-dependent sugar dehydrogenase [Sediminibacillus massiliensis]
MKKKLFSGLILSLVFGLIACDQQESPNNSGSEEQEQPQSEQGKDVSEQSGEEGASENASLNFNNVETLAEDLNVPWELVKEGEDIYISERTGAIVKVNGNNLERKEVRLKENLADEPEAGLLGLAFPADFQETQEAIAYYTYAEQQGVFQRVAFIQEQEGQWVEKETLLDNIPGGNVHHGGRLEIGPDDKLYVTVGDATNRSAAQNRDSLSGSVLRMNLDGTIPEDNPFEDSLIYTWGHRNPQGLAWDEQEVLFATEHGNQAHDEINKLSAGSNYGWPEIQGDEQMDGMEQPVLHSGEETWAPSGMDYFNGRFYFASLRGEALREFHPEENSQQVVLEGFGRIRDVLATDEGLYVVTNNTDGRGNPDEKDDRLLFVPRS